MSNKLSPGAEEILNQVLAAMQDAEELGGTDGTDDYLALMERIAEEAVKRHSAANSERGCGEVGPEIRLTKIDA